MFSGHWARKCLVWIDVQSELQHKFYIVRLKSYILTFTVFQKLLEKQIWFIKMICFAWEEKDINV